MNSLSLPAIGQSLNLHFTPKTLIHTIITHVLSIVCETTLSAFTGNSPQVAPQKEYISILTLVPKKLVSSTSWKELSFLKSPLNRINRLYSPLSIEITKEEKYIITVLTTNNNIIKTHAQYNTIHSIEGRYCRSLEYFQVNKANIHDILSKDIRNITND